MFVDASALVALLADEPEAGRISGALASADRCMTSPVAILETALALARPEKFDMTIEAVGPIVLEFLAARSIEICDHPPASETTALAPCRRRIDTGQAGTVSTSGTASTTPRPGSSTCRSSPRRTSFAGPIWRLFADGPVMDRSAFKHSTDRCSRWECRRRPAMASAAQRQGR